MEQPICEKTKELIAIAASVAANCKPCLQHHYKKALELGNSEENIITAIKIGEMVKDQPSQHIRSLANHLLDKEVLSGIPMEAPRECGGGASSSCSSDTNTSCCSEVTSSCCPTTNNHNPCCG